MASTIFNVPCNVGELRVSDYTSLKPSLNRRLASLRPSIRVPGRPVLTVRAGETREGPMKKLGLSDEECEAAVAAGKVPDAPPPPSTPAAPARTPVVSSLPISRRPRRNRRTPALRAAFQETSISPANFVSKVRDVGVNSIVLFPKVPDALKTPTGDEAYNENGLVPRTIRLLKDKYPDLVIYKDVALDPYSSDGHDGIVREDGVIMNDETVHQLCKQAVAQARAGADVVSPSDMMDGRVGAIRAALDADGAREGGGGWGMFSFNERGSPPRSRDFRYASSFYGPFREALGSNPRFGDKKTYQMNPANYREALVEARGDKSEGADILLVKPGLPYLDIIRLLWDNSPLPIAAYQVSGEYSMIKAGGVLKMIDEERVMMESLMCLRRAGADIILTYFALQAARCLCGEKR
ncbi:hypothetical protein RJ639_032282 [Escallonia herrerae]|uniref:Delta-aminolevulinic acid dehydratase n=1 Tax=Escallonia herrerae TaxID=1293975 RepID=A0AA89B9A6_9ASTE|nr:hypothetical protein RJ639_032282 [Escallonia herrerae]